MLEISVLDGSLTPIFAINRIGSTQY